jgi:hypothetical protein
MEGIHYTVCCKQRKPRRNERAQHTNNKKTDHRRLNFNSVEKILGIQLTILVKCAVILGPPARDVIHDVTDVRRHVGGIFFALHAQVVLMEITLENGRKRSNASNQTGTRRQDVEGIHLPSFRFSWKLKKLCRVDFFVFESWQTAVKSQGKTIIRLQYGGRPSMTSSRDVTASAL